MACISFEDLEVQNLKDKCLCDHEHGLHSSTLLIFNDVDRTIRPKYPEVADDYDEI